MNNRGAEIAKGGKKTFAARAMNDSTTQEADLSVCSMVGPPGTGSCP